MYPIVKRLIDCTLALLGIIVTLPILVVVALMIKVTSPGPIFYTGTRTGKNGVPF
ncbi:MAG: sugar transferase, partial [Chloroflexaceae bacterium]|nr:sugar transferase [Chloroflexaceae bacterium]